MVIVDLVKKTRTEWGLNQREFGRVVGYSSSYISKIELGAEVSEKTAGKIKAAISGTDAETAKHLSSLRKTSEPQVDEKADCLAIARAVAESNLKRITVEEFLYLQGLVSSLKNPPSSSLLEELVMNHRRF